MRFALAGIGSMALLAGCMTPAEEEVPTRADSRFACDASRVQTMVGRTGTRELGTEAVRAANARTMRWITPDGAYTMDYRTDRLNIHLDARNQVTKIDCG